MLCWPALRQYLKHPTASHTTLDLCIEATKSSKLNKPGLRKHRGIPGASQLLLLPYHAWKQQSPPRDTAHKGKHQGQVFKRVIQFHWLPLGLGSFKLPRFLAFNPNEVISLCVCILIFLGVLTFEKVWEHCYGPSRAEWFSICILRNLGIFPNESVGQ